jgi:hypothetical protein
VSTTKECHDWDQQQQLATRGYPVRMTQGEYYLSAARNQIRIERTEASAIPQRRRNVKLAFVSQRGKNRFRALVWRYERREIQAK